MPDRGSLATIFCTGLAVNGVLNAGQLPLPTALAGVTVTAGGAPAPLLAVANLGAYQQINFQVPQAMVVSPDGTMQVVVSQNGTSGSGTATFVYHSPGAFFQVISNGRQLGAFQHAIDYSLVTTDNPAVAGETIIGYLTGLPPVVPAVPDGQPAPASPLPVEPQPDTQARIVQFSVYVGGPFPVYDLANQAASPISYIGLSPGSVGLYQVNFVLSQLPFTGLQAVQLVETYCIAISGDCRQRPLSPEIAPPVLMPVQ